MFREGRELLCPKGRGEMVERSQSSRQGAILQGLVGTFWWGVYPKFK